MPDDSEDLLIPRAHTRSFSPTHTGHYTPTSTTLMMDDLRHTRPKKKKGGWVVVLSYVFDWVIIGVAGGIGYVLGESTPNKRPFSLHDPDISYVKLQVFFNSFCSINFMVAMLRRTTSPDSPLLNTRPCPCGWQLSSACSLPSSSSPSSR